MVANRKADRIAAETKLAVELSQLDATLEEKIDRFMARFDFPSRVSCTTNLLPPPGATFVPDATLGGNRLSVAQLLDSVSIPISEWCS